MLTKQMTAKLDRSEAIRLLKLWREENLRKSKDIVEIYEYFLKANVKYLGNEAWLIYEQVLVAALDIGKFELANDCFKELEDKFPRSLRVAKLYGYLLEFQEKYDEAQKLYTSILNKDSSNSLVYKRKITILKEQNKIPQAIQDLNEYLKLFMSDIEAWHELCDLYLVVMEYDKAAFCMEELILSNSRNYYYHMKYAEIKYSQGGMENLEIARCHFCFSYKLNSKNIRSLYGIALVSCNLMSSTKNNTPKKSRENQICYDWACNQIQRLYTKNLKDHPNEIESLKIVTKSLDSLQIIS